MITRTFPRFAAIAAVLALALASVSAVSAKGAGGVTGPAFYVDGQVYRTVNTPTHHLAQTGAPDHSFDTIYAVGGGQMNVATAAPGDTGYNGGRWRVVQLNYNSSYSAALAAHDLNNNGVFDSAGEIDSALADSGSSGATAGPVIDSFVCPVIKLPKSGQP
jgi:hypothetical protein